MRSAAPDNATPGGTAGSQAGGAEAGVLVRGEVKAALLLGTEEAPCAIVLAGRNRDRGVPVANGLVALLVERMPGQVVRAEVVLDPILAPIEDGVDLHAAVLHAHLGQPLTVLRLIGAQACQP